MINPNEAAHWTCKLCKEDIQIYNNGQNRLFRFSIWKCKRCATKLIEILFWNNKAEKWTNFNNLNLTGGIYDL